LTYGGHGTEIEKRARVEHLIKQQWINVNKYYNHQDGFQSQFNFLPYKFDYFEDYPNATHMDNIDYNIPLPEDNCDYRIIYSHSPYGGNMLNMHSDYFNRSIRFALNPELEWNETIWDQYSTRILSHELAHSRGAHDLYSVNVDGNKNEIFSGVNYNYPVGSIMNYLYDLNTNFDEHSLYIINQYAGQIVTPKMASDMFWSLFPLKFGVKVKDMFDNPIRNTTVIFYGVRWLQESINANNQFERKTDDDGKVTFYGNDTMNNPYEKTGPISFSTFSNFMVTVYNEVCRKVRCFIRIKCFLFYIKGNGLFNWLPVFIVQTEKIQNKTEYYIEFQFNMKPNIEFLTTSLNLSVPQFINSYDLSCQMHYTLVAKVNLSVNAWDIDGNITKVEFFSNDQLLGEVFIPPYSLEWYISSNGTYNLMAKAYDNLNGINQSKIIIINVMSEELGVDTAINMITNNECLV